MVGSDGLNKLFAWSGLHLSAGGEWLYFVVAFALLVFTAALLIRRTITAIMTLRALAHAPSLSRILSHLVGSLDYSDSEFMTADGARGMWPEVRRQAINRLADFFQSNSSKSIAW